MNNEYKYRQQLLEAMEAFLAQDVSGDVGAIPEQSAKLMADAAFNILLALEAATTFIENQR